MGQCSLSPVAVSRQFVWGLLPADHEAACERLEEEADDSVQGGGWAWLWWGGSRVGIPAQPWDAESILWFVPVLSRQCLHPSDQPWFQCEPGKLAQHMLAVSVSDGCVSCRNTCPISTLLVVCLAWLCSMDSTWMLALLFPSTRWVYSDVIPQLLYMWFCSSQRSIKAQLQIRS